LGLSAVVVPSPACQHRFGSSVRTGYHADGRRTREGLHVTPAERIRVHIAGDIYPRRALVRRFLEDDGYHVTGHTTSRKTLLAAIRKHEPDAIVIDDDLLAATPSGGTLTRIRKAAPDAKVIVFTSSPLFEAGATAGADGYLEKGVGLAALTSLLGRLFADGSAAMAPVAVGATGAGARIAASGPVADPGRGAREPVGATANGSSAATTARLVAIAGGAILIVWGMIAMLATGGGLTPPPLDRTEGGGTVIAGDDALDEAYAALRRLMTSIESGNYVLAGIEAEELMEAREQAAAEGFAVIGLDAEVTARLGTIVDVLPLRVNAMLSAILGSLYPVLPDEDVPGGGSDVIIGPVFTGADTGGSTGGDTGGNIGVNPVGNGNGGGIVVVGPGGNNNGNGGGGGEPEPALAPGDGRAWGHSHKEQHVVGEVPPWANGKAVGHDKSNGKAVGHGRSVGNDK
jgi:DNA-binding NarL/FixJ family response regulator